MPMSGSLSTEDIATLKAWIDQGARWDAPVSFARDVQPLFEGSCASCHGDTAQLSRFDLRTRESALRGGARGSDIVPGNADGSRLYRRIAGLEQPSMPAQGTPLTAAQVAVVKQWIDEGAKWDAVASSSTARAAAAASLAALENRAITPEERNYWAFKLPVQAPLPALDNLALTSPIDRFLEPRSPRARVESRPPRRRLHPRAARVPRFARSAADAGAGRRVRERQIARRLGAARRRSARLAALRRALRPDVAGRRALRGFRRLRVRHASAQRVAVPRLRDQVLQRRQAVQHVPRRADRGRRDGRPDRRRASSRRAFFAWARGCSSARRTTRNGGTTTSTKSSGRSARARWA